MAFSAERAHGEVRCASHILSFIRLNINFVQLDKRLSGQ
jgi:hypothetical protein